MRVFLLLFLFLSTTQAEAIEVTKLIKRYFAVPPFLQMGNVKPNVLLVVDNSGSMKRPAYWPSDRSYDDTDDTYDDGKSYYGIFDPNARYAYNETGGYFYEDESGNWSGNFLNWLTMRRYDVLMKVLTGGFCKEEKIERTSSNATFVRGMSVCISKYGKSTEYCLFNNPTHHKTFLKSYNGTLYRVGVDCDGDYKTRKDRYCFCRVSPDDTTECIGKRYRIRIKVDECPEGLVQKFASKMRLGLMTFNYKGEKTELHKSKHKDGGMVLVQVGENNGEEIISLFKEIDDYDRRKYSDRDGRPYLYPDSYTPLGETYYEAALYFSGADSYYNDGVSYTSPIEYPCQKNFIILISDGEPAMDRNVPAFLQNATSEVLENEFGCTEGAVNCCIADIYNGNRSKYNKYRSSCYLLGASYYFHTHDVSDFEGKQTLTLYTVYAFEKGDRGRKLLELAAKYGGFHDENKNGVPDLPEEWDRNGDGVADNFFEADEGGKLEESLYQVFYEILKKTSSGTAVGLPTQKRAASSVRTSHSVVLQALFYPQKRFDEGGTVDWAGYLYSWWLFNSPRTQNIREDTNGNCVLDVREDRILKWTMSEDGELEIVAYGSKSDGSKDENNATIYYSFDETNPLWEAGNLLLNEPSSDRTIYANIDGRLENFTPNAAIVVNYLKSLYGFSSEEAVKLINYIRGIDYPSFRNRRTDGAVPPANGSDENVWKLGDIIYSTPWIEDYGNYTVAFVGANDGMLHAFKIGFLKKTNSPLSPVRLQNGLRDEETDKLGKELWAFIPQNALPYLALLASKEYKHLYTVDLSPLVVNEKGRKILIGGMRLGGAVGSSSPDAVSPPSYACSSKKCVGLSSYFALDVTNPEHPKLLWEFTDKELGFTYSGVGVVRVKIDGKDEYYAVFASGQINYDGIYESGDEDTLKIFILDLNNGNVIRVIDTGKKDAFGGRIMKWGEDLDGDGYTDYLIFGYTQKDGNNYKGGLIFLAGGKEGNKLIPLNSRTPQEWSIEDVSGLGKRIPPVVSKVTVGKCFNSWYVYFGTGRWFYKDDDAEVEDNLLFGVPLKVTYEGTKVTSIEVIKSTKDVTSEQDTENICESSSPVGWFIRLNGENKDYLREKDITDPTVRNNIVFFVTIQPSSNPCKFGGRSRMWGLNCALGGSIYSSCQKAGNEEKYAVAPPKGVLYLQLSGSNIVVVNPATAFGSRENPSRHTEWFTGIAPEGDVPFVENSRRLRGRLLFWLER